MRPLALGLHHYILNSRDLYGLPRKFNVAFDNGGQISVASDTNDIGFVPVRIEEGHQIQSGVYFRVELGGITGHKTFAADCGILIRPEDCLAVAVAMIRVFIENGDRTNRKKARLKYLLEKWGIPKFVDESEKKLSFSFTRVPLKQCQQRRQIVRHAHIGTHPQAEEDYYYVGAVIPVGRMSVEQAARLADLARRYGRAEVRLTVFQNMLIPYVHREDLDKVKAELLKMGFHYEASSIKGGLVACTGNTGCKFAATNTKGQAVELARQLEQRVKLDTSINIHLTGCHHSCAQHYCGDIGLLGVGAKNAQGEAVEGYTISVGGGMDHEQGIGREIFPQVPFEEVPELLEAVLNTYLEKRNPDESFVDFTRRHEIDDLVQMVKETSA